MSREPRKAPDPRCCILDCDSPSFPPEEDEYRQCGCYDCVRYLLRKAEAREKSAFFAGYHAIWDTRHWQWLFDRNLKPGDPEHAFAAWERQDKPNTVQQ